MDLRNLPGTGGLAIEGAPVVGTQTGPLTNRLSLSFTSQGMTSTYHLFAAGLDWSEPVGLLVYMDGSGAFGLDNPNDPYLLDADGTTGLKQVAVDRNLLLLTPIAPPPSDADGDNCWYNTSTTPTAVSKASWLNDLMTYVKGQYAVASNRIIVGGYSSGAQGTSEFFMPQFGESQSVDLAVSISYGGSPKTTASFTPGYKAATHAVWDVGTSDPSYQSSGAYGVQAGYDWYTTAGFQTKLVTHAGTHSRSDFDVVMAREIDLYVPTTPPDWKTTVTPTQHGGSFAIYVPTSYSGSTYVTLSSGNYLYTTLNGDRTLTFVSQSCGTTLSWQTRTGSTTGPVMAFGTLTTLAC